MIHVLSFRTAWLILVHSKAPYFFLNPASGLFLRESLVVLETSHPLRPVFGLYAAGFGPRACRVPTRIPFEGPQFLQADLSDRPIHEKNVDVPIMPVYAEMWCC